MTTERTNVVFIHGLWLHASSWDPWAELFRTAGYAPVAPGWPGVPGTVAGLALAEEKYGSGRFTLADLIAPALALAREGMAVTEVKGRWAKSVPTPAPGNAPKPISQ